MPSDRLVCLFVLTEIREAFRVLDHDGNGFISKQELGMAMRSLGYMPSEVELAIIMQRLDMDGEFLSTCRHTIQPPLYYLFMYRSRVLLNLFNLSPLKSARSVSAE